MIIINYVNFRLTIIIIIIIIIKNLSLIILLIIDYLLLEFAKFQ